MKNKEMISPCRFCKHSQRKKKILSTCECGLHCKYVDELRGEKK